MRKILVVDDRPEIRELLKVTLEDSDCTILQAADGAEALTTARREKPDLMILDIMMPGGIDGYEVCRRLKSDEATRSIKIVMLTAKGQKVDMEKGAKVGADDYFVKPFSPLELLNKVSEILS